MKAERPYPQIAITPKGEAALTGGHPWVYEGEVTSVTGSPADGDLVDVVSRRGSWLGAGFYNSRSLIRVRLLSRNPNDRFDPDFWARRVKYAWDYRKTVMAPEELTCCRVIFGEADHFPGLTVDRFGPVLVAQVLCLGLDRVKDTIFSQLVRVLREDGQDIAGIYERNDVALRDKEGMAHFYAAYNIYNLLLMVSTAGLPLALSRLVSQAEALGWVNRRRRIVSVAFWLFLLLGLLSSGLMFFLAGDLAGWMHNTRAEDAIRVLSPAVLCVCLVSVIRGYTQGMGDMRPTAASEIIESGSKLVVGLGLAWFIMKQKNDTALAAGAIAGVTAGVILSLLALTVWTATHLSRDKGRDDPGQSRDILRQLLAIGVPITVGSVSLSVINLLDQSITMGILQTSWGLTEPEAAGLYGTYSYAGNLFALPAAFIYPLTISLIPAIGAALARGDRSAAGRHTAAAFRLTALLALPAGVGLSVLARPILELLYPTKGAATLEAAAYHLEILGVGSIFVCLMALSNGILQAYGREKVPLWTLLAGGGLKIALNYLMISNPDYGIRGLPVSTLCCYALITVLNLGAIARYVPERPDYFRVFSRPGLAALGMGAAAWWLHRLLADLLPGGLATLLAVALAAVIYAGAALLLGAVGREEAMALPGGERLVRWLRLK